MGLEKDHLCMGFYGCLGEQFISFDDFLEDFRDFVDKKYRNLPKKAKKIYAPYSRRDINVFPKYDAQIFFLVF